MGIISKCYSIAFCVVIYQIDIIVFTSAMSVENSTENLVYFTNSAQFIYNFLGVKILTSNTQRNTSSTSTAHARDILILVRFQRCGQTRQ
jgi:uncharacterized protein (DUF4213/DUF364 family)